MYNKNDHLAKWSIFVRYSMSSFAYTNPSPPLKIVTFVIEKMKLASFSLFLDAFPPRPKMPFGQLNVAIQIYIYNICKGRLGSRGGGG